MAGEKFTEGSWRVEWVKDESGESYFDILKNDGDAGDDGRMVDASYCIVEMAYPVIDNEEEGEANAWLMAAGLRDPAAAPDLYAALNALSREITRGHTQGHDERRLRALVRNADMTLACARGEDYRYGEDDL